MIKIKEMLKYCAVFLRLEELELWLNLDENDLSVMSADVKKQYDLMLISTNLVLEEIASQYIDLVKTEDVVFSNGKIDISSLESRVKKIISTYSKDGKKIYFEKNGNELLVNVSDGRIKYSYFPSEVKSVDEEVGEWAYPLTDRVVAYAVASEFAFICAMYEESNAWNNRFIDSIKNIVRKSSAGQAKAARW